MQPEFSQQAESRVGTLLHGTLIAVAVCGFSVVVCYFFIDRPVAFFVHDYRVEKVEQIRWLTEPPPLMQVWAPLVIVILALRRALSSWQHALFIACVALIVADQFRESLGDLFGRYWPETWHDNNPSLIGTGDYGFVFFKADSDNGGFPSGHAARIVAFTTVFWLAMPRGRWVYACVATPMLVALVAMNYHFVSDVIAGSILGAIIGAWTTQLGLTGFRRSTG